MQIDYCLILAAGFGKRMGTIGERLPKVLWPVFEKSLLELQVAYAKSLGIKKIYINLYHMGEQIAEYCKTRSQFDDVHFLWESPEILDIGGAVHNLASQPQVKYRGKLLILNADQFFYMKKEELVKILSPFSKSPSVLLTYKVNSSDGYNALEIDENRMVKGITQNKDLSPNQMVETYTGISLVDLSQLEQIKGPSSFFKSVCNFGEKKIPAVLLEHVDYWDFGTLSRYWDTCFRILSTYRVKSTHPFIRFLVEAKALKTWKINLQNLSYHSLSKQTINLNEDEERSNLDSSIILLGNGAVKKQVKAIWWNNICEEIK